jgi:hypothetical protein
METSLDLLRGVMGGPDPLGLTDTVANIISGEMYLHPDWMTPEVRVFRADASAT